MGRYWGRSKRSKSQLNAISRSYTAKRQQEQQDKMKQNGLDRIFEYQSTYKTVRGLNNASPEKLAKVAEEALKRAETRKGQIEKSGPQAKQGWKYKEVIADIQIIRKRTNQAKREAISLQSKTKKTASRKPSPKKKK